MFGFRRNKIALPPNAKKIAMPAPYTKDYAALAQRPRQLLFVYCEMKSSHPQHDLLSEYAEKQGVIYSRNVFHMVKTRMGQDSYPIAFEKDAFSGNSFRIRGELYSVRPRLFLKLDEHKQNGVQFERKEIWGMMPYQEGIKLTDGTIVDVKDKLHVMQMWAYVAKFDYWKDEIDGGFQYPIVDTYTNNRHHKYELGSYFDFKKKEYDE